MKKIKYRTKRKIAIVSIVAAFAVFAITPIGQSTVLTAIDCADNLVHGKFGINVEKRVESFENNINSGLLNQFVKSGGTIKIFDTYEVETNNQDLAQKGTTLGGVYSPSKKQISYAQSTDSISVYHEFGHFIDMDLGKKYTGQNFSENDTFLKITENEIERFNKETLVFNGTNYTLNYYIEKQKASEYFAEAFAYYMVLPRTLKHVAPATYEYMDMLYTTITQ